MGEESGKSSRLRESGCRIAILAVVTGCHVGLLMLLLRPVVFRRDVMPEVRNNPLALKLRFFRSPPSSSYPALPEHRLLAPVMHGRTTPSAGSSKPLAARQAAHVDAPLHETRPTSARNLDAGEEDSIGDGGFRKRLRDAQHSRSVRGVPGSDTPFAPGIRLVDPMSQGIGAVIRKAQRALGVKDSHCVDVDAWRHLTPQELIARHVSPGDVDKVDRKYNCNEPPGLRF